MASLVITIWWMRDRWPWVIEHDGDWDSLVVQNWFTRVLAVLILYGCSGVQARVSLNTYCVTSKCAKFFCLNVPRLRMS